MAFFNFPWSSGQQDAGTSKARRGRAAQAESIEELRRRARHRLIGAVVLVLIGVVVFPLIFDTQPRPVPVDVAITIPDRNTAPPLVVAPAPAKASDEKLPGDAGLSPGEEQVGHGAAGGEPTPAQKVEPKTLAKVEPKPEPPKAEPKPEPAKPAVTAPAPASAPKGSRDDAERARALLEGRASASASSVAAPAAQGRFIVQVGAFADQAKVREVRAKLEKAGIKTYAQAVETKDGQRTRVRVGPFTDRAEADKALGRVKSVGLDGQVLSL